MHCRRAQNSRSGRRGLSCQLTGVKGCPGNFSFQVALVPGRAPPSALRVSKFDYLCYAGEELRILAVHTTADGRDIGAEESSLVRKEPVNVAAVGTDQARSRGLCPTDAKETRHRCVYLSIFPPEAIIVTNETVKGFSVDCSGFRFVLVEKAHCLTLPFWPLFPGLSSGRFGSRIEAVSLHSIRTICFAWESTALFCSPFVEASY